MKTTVELPDDLLLRAKRLATNTQTTLRELMIAGLESEIAQREATPPVDFKWVTARGGRLLVDPKDAIAISYGMPE